MTINIGTQNGVSTSKDGLPTGLELQSGGLDGDNTLQPYWLLEDEDIGELSETVEPISTIPKGFIS